MKKCKDCHELRKAHHFDQYGHCLAWRITVREDFDAEHCPGWKECEPVKLPKKEADDANPASD